MANFWHGFVYECDIPEEGMLTIEGMQVDGFKRTPDGVSARLPGNNEVITAPTESLLVADYLVHTRAVQERETTTREHLDILRGGTIPWNNWRRDKPTVQPMLANVNASTQFPDVCLDGCNFSYANLTDACLSRASLKRANFHQAILANADFSGAHLEGANFCRTDLYMTDFTGAHLEGANLQGVQLTRTILSGAHLDGCNVYGLSAWDLKRDDETKDNLIIRYRLPGEEKDRTELVDDLDLAAFMYLTVSNQNVARIIDAASRKWVLILGRFTKGREVLDAVAAAVRRENMIPVIFDFNRPQGRDLIETVLLLAGMSAFVVVDISDPRSTPLELHAIATSYGVPIFPIMAEGSNGFSLFPPLRRFRWVFPPMSYKDTSDLESRLSGEVFGPARNEIRRLGDLKRAVEVRAFEASVTEDRHADLD